MHAEYGEIIFLLIVRICSIREKESSSSCDNDFQSLPEKKNKEIIAPAVETPQDGHEIVTWSWIRSQTSSELVFTDRNEQTLWDFFTGVRICLDGRHTHSLIFWGACWHSRCSWECQTVRARSGEAENTPPSARKVFIEFLSHAANSQTALNLLHSCVYISFRPHLFFMLVSVFLRGFDFLWVILLEKYFPITCRSYSSVWSPSLLKKP